MKRSVVIGVIAGAAAVTVASSSLVAAEPETCLLYTSDAADE